MVAPLAGVPNGPVALFGGTERTAPGLGVIGTGVVPGIGGAEIIWLGFAGVATGPEAGIGAIGPPGTADILPIGTGAPAEGINSLRTPGPVFELNVVLLTFGMGEVLLKAAGAVASNPGAGGGGGGGVIAPAPEPKGGTEGAGGAGILGTGGGGVPPKPVGGTAGNGASGFLVSVAGDGTGGIAGDGAGGSFISLTPTGAGRGGGITGAGAPVEGTGGMLTSPDLGVSAGGGGGGGMLPGNGGSSALGVSMGNGGMPDLSAGTLPGNGGIPPALGSGGGNGGRPGFSGSAAFFSSPFVRTMPSLDGTGSKSMLVGETGVTLASFLSLLATWTSFAASFSAEGAGSIIFFVITAPKRPRNEAVTIRPALVSRVIMDPSFVRKKADACRPKGPHP